MFQVKLDSGKIATVYAADAFHGMLLVYVGGRFRQVSIEDCKLLDDYTSSTDIRQAQILLPCPCCGDRVELLAGICDDLTWPYIAHICGNCTIHMEGERVPREDIIASNAARMRLCRAWNTRR